MADWAELHRILYEETDSWLTYLGKDHILMIHKESNLKGTIHFADDVLSWKQVRCMIPEFQEKIRFQIECKLKEEYNE